MKALILLLSFVAVAGCVTSGSTNRAVANVGYYNARFYLEVLKPRCQLTEPKGECTDLYVRLKRRTRPPMPTSLRNYAYSCIEDKCPAGPDFRSCISDCVDKAQDRYR